MKSVSGKRLCQILEQHGWVLQRVNGSHHIFVKTGSVLRISVPVHSNHDLKQGLLLHILKVAGLSERDLS